MMMPLFTTPAGKHYFFGYYDKSPLSADGRYLLAMEVDFIDRVPTKDDVARIGFFTLNLQGNSSDVITSEFTLLTETHTFNWQQGCMLQWLGPDFSSRFIFNDCVDGQFVSIIYDVCTQEKRQLPYAIYAVNGQQALCIDFERHYWCRRGYAYDGVVNPQKNVAIVPGDGIWCLDWVSEEYKQVVSLQKVLKHKPLSIMQNATHYLEHMMWNPSGTRFAFLHRWKMADGGIYARLYTVNADGSDLYLLNDSGRMSHYGWLNDSQLIGWGGLVNAINRLRQYRVLVKMLIKPLLPLYKKLVSGNAVHGTTRISSLVTGDSYIVFNDKTHRHQRIGLDQLDRDGHPSGHPNWQQAFITDTYPDRQSVCQLLHYQINHQKKTVIAELKSLPEYDNSPLRCDLHPKISFDGRYVCVDTMDAGGRGMYLYQLPKTLTA